MILLKEFSFSLLKGEERDWLLYLLDVSLHFPAKKKIILKFLLFLTVKRHNYLIKDAFITRGRNLAQGSLHYSTISFALQQCWVNLTNSRTLLWQPCATLSCVQVVGQHLKNYATSLHTLAISCRRGACTS